MPTGVAPDSTPCAENMVAEQKQAPIDDIAEMPTIDTLPACLRDRSRDAFGELGQRGEPIVPDLEGARGGCDPAALQQKIAAEATAAARAARAAPWCESGLEMVRPLQAAPGNCGQVDLMMTISEGCFVAVKRMPNSWMQSGPDEFAERSGDAPEKPWFDIGVCRHLHRQGFRYLCRPQGIYRDGLFTYVVSEFASGGDLYGLMESDPSPGESREALIQPIMQQVFSAVRCLHDRGIAHRDLSLENFLLTEGGAVKLIDYGMATLSRSCTEGVGKESYIAPEIFEEGVYDPFKSDAFALGVLLFSLAARTYPWHATEPGRCKLFSFVRAEGLRALVQRKRVWKGNGETLSDVFSASLTDLTEALLSVDPETRLSLGERCFCEGDARPSVWDSEWLGCASGAEETDSTGTPQSHELTGTNHDDFEGTPGILSPPMLPVFGFFGAA